MAGERDAKTRSDELAAEVASLKSRITQLEEECSRMKTEMAQKDEQIEGLIEKYYKEAERADRAEEKERQRSPDPETMRKIKVTTNQSCQLHLRFCFWVSSAKCGSCAGHDCKSNAC